MTEQAEHRELADSPFRLGDWLVEPSLNRLIRGGETIQLELKVMDVLVCLAERAGEVVSRREIVDRVWATEFIADNTLTHAITDLRNAFGDDSRTPRFIETIHGRGYRLIAQISFDDPPAGSQELWLPECPKPRDAPTEAAMKRTQRHDERARHPRLVTLVAAAGAVVVVLGVVFARWPVALRSRGAASDHIRSIAVLPLVNISGDPEQESFADGMTDALITELAQISAFEKVISRTSTMQLKGTDIPIPEIAARLGVKAIVEGSVQRSDDRVRVTLQLIEGPNDRHLWAGSFDRSVTDVLALQSELARTLAAEIEVSLTPEEETRLARSRPIDRDAYELYLRATQLPRFTEANYLRAIEYYEKSIERDPSFAPAHAGLGWTLGSFATKYRPPAEVMPRALEEVSRALELDESLAEAHARLGRIRYSWQWDWSSAEAEFLRGLELGPNNIVVLEKYAVFLAHVGRFDEAVAVGRRARELDPVGPRGLAWLYVYAGRYDEAIAELLEVTELNPNNAGAHFFLSLCYAAKGMFDEAREADERATTLYPKSDEDPYWLALRGCRDAMTGERAQAVASVERLLELRKRRYVPPFWMALEFTALGDDDRAFEWLERSYEMHDVLLAHVVGSRAMDPLRDDPRFHDLLRRINAPTS